MNKGVSQAQEQPKGADKPQNACLNDFLGKQDERDTIIITTIEGTILNEGNEIPNTAFFLKMLKDSNDHHFAYIGSNPAKEMKQIRKIMHNFNFPVGITLLQEKGMEHHKYHIQSLKRQYNIICLITSDPDVADYSESFKIPVIKIKKNTEWDHNTRRKIIARVGKCSSY